MELRKSSERTCPNCGDGFAAGGRGVGKRFCSPDCREKYHDRAKGEGAAAIKLVKAWIGTRHAPTGTREAAICRTARRELTQLAEALIQRDRDMGRSPASDYIGDLSDARSMVTDRVRL